MIDQKHKLQTGKLDRIVRRRDVELEISYKGGHRHLFLVFSILLQQCHKRLSTRLLIKTNLPLLYGIE